ncbi:hypothetical protein DC31_05515 [Microbacterium sp. CH12i]|uniref:hypothetical protein n=1 Tax=Microbacterium sp. CH12i TaxID=1479651 RepID=UPI000460BA82|nr:hypothetical protein [Microbacterium sp. CH12i]KDA04775.1 hypothetical protein DC31_05515 [Microbacterium sp. CH12i]
METTDITVPVPTQQVANFYRWFAEWTEQNGHFPAEAAALNTNAATLSEQDQKAAVRWWQSLGLREREIFGLWIDAAPNVLSADEIVNRMSLKGPRDIPGILSWPTRKGKKVGFRVRWSFRRDPLTDEALYGIEDGPYATLLGRARAFVEGE